MKVRLVFEDWCKIGKWGSVYQTEEGVELSMGDFHSGTVFHADLIIDADADREIEEAHVKGYYPVFAVLPENVKQLSKKDGGTDTSLWPDDLDVQEYPSEFTSSAPSADTLDFGDSVPRGRKPRVPGALGPGQKRRSSLRHPSNGP